MLCLYVAFGLCCVLICPHFVFFTPNSSMSCLYFHAETPTTTYTQHKAQITHTQNCICVSSKGFDLKKINNSFLRTENDTKINKKLKATVVCPLCCKKYKPKRKRQTQKKHTQTNKNTQKKEHILSFIAAHSQKNYITVGRES